MTMSKPNDESEEGVHQTNECLDQGNSQPQHSQAMPVNESLSSDQCVKVRETDTDDVPPQLEETASALAPPPFTSTCTPPGSRATISSDTEQRIEEKGKTIEQHQQSPTAKIDVSIAGRSTEDGSSGTSTGHSTRTGEDSNSGTGKTGHSIRTKRKRRTTTHKTQHGELMVVHSWWGQGNFGEAINLVIWQMKIIW